MKEGIFGSNYNCKECFLKILLFSDFKVYQ